MMDRGLGHVMIYTVMPLMLELIPFVYSQERKWIRLTVCPSSPILPRSWFVHSSSLPFILLLPATWFIAVLSSLSYSSCSHLSCVICHLPLHSFSLHMCFSVTMQSWPLEPTYCGPSKWTPISSPWYLLYSLLWCKHKEHLQCYFV